MTPDDPRHGQYRGYRAHRVAGEEACEPCKRAAAGAEQRYQLARLEGKPLRLPAAGTQRRLRALQALGWTITEIAHGMGVPRSRVEKWCSDQKTYVYASNAALVAAVYERLSGTSPTGPWADRNRGMAARKGYHPPIAWDDDNIDDPTAEPYASEDGPDDVVVERLMAGHKVPSRRVDKVEAMRRWLAAGNSELSLCRMHGWAQARYVVRQDGAA